jgi:hypothetical protein
MSSFASSSHDYSQQQVSVSDFMAQHPEECSGPGGKLRVAIGGGAGFIGSHIAKRLRQEVLAACQGEALLDTCAHPVYCIFPNQNRAAT